ncbi:winged helix DNA-binding domain-containing protein [Marinomonas pontica]|nr:winged helix DNA-binding domain-containing protein [Marinomonas pontica]
MPYKQAIKSGQTHWNKNPDRTLMAELLDRIRKEGPLRSRDVEATTTNRAGWWDWKPAKKALEQLFMEGDLMVKDRVGFQKNYDLTERVLPNNVSTVMPSVEEFAAHMLDQQLRCHGVVSLKGITYLRRQTGLRQTMKELLKERMAQGSLEQVQLSNGEVFFIETGALERRLPIVSKRLLILSPFDNSVIQRDRLKNLFQYDYQIECYVPEPKRQYGYFSLPLLYQDRFIGRMDCKAHRKERRLEIKFLHIESLFEENALTDEFLQAFVSGIKLFNSFQQCDSVTLTSVEPKRFAQPLRNLFVQMYLG